MYDTGLNLLLAVSWSSVVRDQLESLRSLLVSSRVTIGLNAGKEDAAHIRNQMDSLKSENIDIGYTNNNASSWRERMEEPTLTLLHQYCKQPEHEDHLVFYMHSKGVTKDNAEYVFLCMLVCINIQCSAHTSYRAWSKVMFWRKYLEYYVIERPEYCIAALQTGQASTCGVDLANDRSHYSGNFW
jgi:hypothetical protein